MSNIVHYVTYMRNFIHVKMLSTINGTETFKGKLLSNIILPFEHFEQFPT